jgi:hypothetical protein
MAATIGYPSHAARCSWQQLPYLTRERLKGADFGDRFAGAPLVSVGRRCARSNGTDKRSGKLVTSNLHKG